MNTTQTNLDITVSDSEVTEVETTEVVVASTPNSALAMISLAVEKGLSADTIEKLYTLHERISDRFEARSFNAALARFQMDCPIIKQGGTNKQLTDSGTGKSQTYARLEKDILPVVGPCLLKHGFSYTWDTQVLPDMLLVTCTLRHVDGHKSSASFGAPPDDRTNRAVSLSQKNGQVGAYCRRLSLIQVTGICTGDPDDDATPGAKINQDQLMTIESLMKDVKADNDKFLEYMKVDELGNIPDSEYKKAINALEAKRIETV